MLFFLYESLWRFVYQLVAIYTFCKNKFGKHSSKLDAWVHNRSSSRLACVLEKPFKEEIFSDIWLVHVSSSGELEQALPLMEALHAVGGIRFLITYYSSSALLFVSRLPKTLCVFHHPLPIDIRTCHKKLLKTFCVQHALFVRYDLWPGLLQACLDLHIPMTLVVATKVRSSSFRWIRAISHVWQKIQYSKFSNVFTVSEEDSAYFRTVLPEDKIHLGGDFKWLRAVQLTTRLPSQPLIQQWLAACRALKSHTPFQESLCVTFGSPHAVEHEIFLSTLRRTAKIPNHTIWIYVPHDVSSETMNLYWYQGIQTALSPSKKVVRFSEWAKNPQPFSLDTAVLFVDAVGFLAYIYGLAHVAVIGGGFDGQLHNVLEPVAQNAYVFMGPHIRRAPEAQLIVRQGYAMVFPDEESLTLLLTQLCQPGDDSLQKILNIRKLMAAYMASIPQDGAYTCAKQLIRLHDSL